jgi:hypothetical protein
MDRTGWLSAQRPQPCADMAVATGCLGVAHLSIVHGRVCCAESSRGRCSVCGELICAPPSDTLPSGTTDVTPACPTAHLSVTMVEPGCSRSTTADIRAMKRLELISRPVRSTMADLRLHFD